ncbi:aminopeptidase [Candidatus Woesearchaeota archaeon]|nr:aminopeptidase [Candidatus Woesearchaeota archaeon]
MNDERIRKVADILVNYSLKIKKGEYVQVVADTEAEPLLKEIYTLLLRKGAFPILKIDFPWQTYVYYATATDEHLNHFPELSLEEMKKMDAFIRIDAGRNARSLTNVDPKKISLRQKVVDPINKERLKKKWVIFDYPSDSLAQEAEMSTEEFEDFVYNACIQDWEKKSKEMDKFVKIMSGKIVRIVGNNTDISFSIEGRKWVKGDGRCNMPDGEIFTAPNEKTTEGFIEFDLATIRGGREVAGVRLEFSKGKVVKANAVKNNDYLQGMLNTDEGARYLGELGIGLNEGITKPVRNILFDEKINGTIHLAIGSAYAECGGVNKSAVHWDFIKTMKNGKIFLDGKLVYENGIFI